MLIKYKGKTSLLLRDLSMEIMGKVDLRSSEMLLCAFFFVIAENMTQDQYIAFICSMPPFLKPFCATSPSNSKKNKLFLNQETSKINPVIIRHLQIYVPQECMHSIHNSIKNESHHKNILLKHIA